VPFLISVEDQVAMRALLYPRHHALKLLQLEAEGFRLPSDLVELAADDVQLEGVEDSVVVFINVPKKRECLSTCSPEHFPHVEGAPVQHGPDVVADERCSTHAGNSARAAIQEFIQEGLVRQSMAGGLRPRASPLDVLRSAAVRDPDACGHQERAVRGRGVSAGQDPARRGPQRGEDRHRCSPHRHAALPIGCVPYSVEDDSNARTHTKEAHWTGSSS
jgi:hypothetical protein